MLSLRVCTLADIQPFLRDFAKKAGHIEDIPSEATILGIYVDGRLAGYFILQGYSDGTLEINQGYLRPVARHKRLSYLSMKLLQEQAKACHYKSIILKASRSLRAYTQFMDDLGYKPSSIIFSKQVV